MRIVTSNINFEAEYQQYKTQVRCNINIEQVFADEVSGSLQPNLNFAFEVAVEATASHSNFAIFSLFLFRISVGAC